MNNHTTDNNFLSRKRKTLPNADYHLPSHAIWTEFFLMEHNRPNNHQAKHPLLVCSWLTSTRRKNDTNNKSIKCQRFSKDQNEDHPNEKLRLLSISSAHYNFNSKGRTLQNLQHLLVIFVRGNASVIKRNLNKQTIKMQRSWPHQVQSPQRKVLIMIFMLKGIKLYSMKYLQRRMDLIAHDGKPMVTSDKS